MNLPDGNQQVALINKKFVLRSRINMVVLAVATVLGIYLCYLLTIPFLPALAWSMGFAVLFAPLQRWLERKLNRPSLAAIISVLLIALMAVVPLTFLGQRLVVQATESAAVVETKVKSGEWRSALNAQPRLAPIIDVIEQQIDLPGTLRTFAGWLSNAAGSIVKGSVFQLIGFCLTFYLLFFFLRDRRAILASVESLSPLSNEEMVHLFARIDDTIHATVYGTLAVSAMQGLLGGLMFWWLGLAAPLLWGLVMALLAIVPMLGAFIVWVPAAIFLLLEGSWGKALILTAWGVLVVGTIDNLMRPILVGNRLKLHTVLAFMSVVGGLILFGPAGLILGPVTLSVTLLLLEIWRSRIALAAEIPGETER